MKKKKNKLTLGLATLSVGLFLVAPTAQAAKGDFGVDWAVYQGANGKFGYAKDKFAISQIGGTTNGWSMYDQWTYPSQVQYTIAQGKRAHTYIWWQNVTTNAQADRVLDYFLPKIQTPKGSIVALDIESGYQNTQAIAHAIQRIKNAGYTPVVYGYKNYLVNNTDLHYLAKQAQLWLAEYPNYQVTPNPNYNYFPSFENVGIFQFTSTYIASGLDGDVDLTGITDNGYKKGEADKPKSQTAAVKAGIVADNTSKSDIKAGYTVKVNFSAKNYATGQAIPSFVKGQPHEVLQVSGDRVLLADIMSWVKKSDIEILATNKASGNVELKQQTKDKWTDNLGVTWTKEAATFKVTKGPLHLRWGASPSSSVISVLGNGSEVKYDAYAKTNGFTYVRQPRSNGQYGYIAVRDSQGNLFGTFK